MGCIGAPHTLTHRRHAAATHLTCLKSLCTCERGQKEGHCELKDFPPLCSGSSITSKHPFLSPLASNRPKHILLGFCSLHNICLMKYVAKNFRNVILKLKGRVHLKWCMLSIKHVIIYFRGMCTSVSIEGVLWDRKGHILVLHGVSRHIREYRGIPGYTKLYQDVPR